jgi:hypothetical protein
MGEDSLKNPTGRRQPRMSLRRILPLNGDRLQGGIYCMGHDTIAVTCRDRSPQSVRQMQYVLVGVAFEQSVELCRAPAQ